MLSPDHPLRFRRLLFVAAGILLLAALTVGLTIWGLRNDAIRDAASETGNIATILAEQTARSVQSIDLVLGDVQDRIASRTNALGAESRSVLQSRSINEFLKDRLERLPQADVIALIGWDGKILNTTRMWPAPAADVSDRDYFRHFANNSSRDLFVSGIVSNRVNGVPTIFFSKRLVGPEGEFAGVILVGVKPAHFQHVYSSIDSVRDLSFALLQRNGSVIGRYPDPEDKSDLRMTASSPWHAIVAAGGGTYRSPGYFDGDARLVAVRLLRDYPLVVNVAYSESRALSNWRRRAASLGFGTLIIALCSVALLQALSRQFHQLLEAQRALSLREAGLAEKTEELANAKEQLDAAVNNMAQGLCMFDGQQQLVVGNKRYGEMYGLSAEDLRPGTTLRTILERRVESGNAPEDAEAYVEARIQEVCAGLAYCKENELRDGRIISVTHQPLANGGWVALHQDVTEHKRAEQKIAYMAHHDALTGLPNRLKLREEIEQHLPHVARGGTLAVLYIDLDHFKNVNDSLGHPFGDRLLRAVADRLRACVRETDVVARLGGDEFAIVQVSGAQPLSATALSERLVEAMGAPFDLESHQVVIGTSVGIAVAPNDGLDSDQLLKNADMALYRAKSDGRNTFRFFEPAMDAKVQARRSLERDLRGALAAGEFELFYQPIMDLRSNEVSGFEALLRWNHPVRGRVPPDDFIYLAEETGLITQIGDWVLRTACAEAAKWPSRVKVAVNLSPVQFRNTSLLPTVINALSAARLSARRLELEITENVLLNSSPSTLATLHQLRNLGVRISMDDFGTGHSSLSYLRSFPFDKIKIDRSFVAELGEKDDARAIIRAVSGLGADLRMTTTAEGVETEEQRAYLSAQGISEAQGYLFSSPRPAREIPDLLSELNGRAAA